MIPRWDNLPAIGVAVQPEVGARRETGDAVFSAGPDNSDVADRGVADPALGAGEDVVAAVTDGMRLHL